MDREQMRKQINDEDYIIRIRPSVDEEGVWSGEVDLSIITLPGNPLDDDAYDSIMHLVKMMCASLPIMEEIETIRNVMHDYVKAMNDDIDIEVQLEKELENKIEKELNRRGFNARSQSGLPQIKETTMRDRLFEKIKTSEDVRTLLGWGSLDSIDDDKDIEYRCDSGAIDTYNLDGDNGIILELKNNDANFDAGFQALTYAMERFQKTGIKHRIILVAKKKDIPSDMEIKLNVWRAQGWDIKYFQWQKLMSM